MKLNADVIFENLKEVMPVELSGWKRNGLTLSRPEFYTDDRESFLKDHVYIVTAERMPRRVSLEKGTVIICIGEVPQMSYYKERGCFIKVKDIDPFELSNKVNAIYNKYDAWSERISEILEGTADIEDMVESSVPIFGNPILAMDSNFQIIASAGYEGLEETAPAFEQMGADALSMSALEQFLKEKELLFDVKEPIRLNIMDSSTLSLNLFDTDEYNGSITIEYRRSAYGESHTDLIKYFAGFLRMAMKKNSQVMTSERNVLRKIFIDIINDMPVDTARKKYLEAAKVEKHFICVVANLNNRFAQIPVEYVCKKFERVFPKSVTFECRSNIVSFIETAPLSQGGDASKTLTERIDILTGAMDIKVGISDDFTDPYCAKLYYRQAQAALEHGMLMDPKEKYYAFKHYALMELIINAQNDLPIDMYYTDGLKRLFAHDETSSISYIETLRTYLDNNMSVTAAAAQLYIHRSTLLERLARIERELDEDLKEPNVRLQIQIVLKALQLRDMIVDKTEE